MAIVFKVVGEIEVSTYIVFVCITRHSFYYRLEDSIIGRAGNILDIG
jgi:hypothetical protein